MATSPRQVFLNSRTYGFRHVLPRHRKTFLPPRVSRSGRKYFFPTPGVQVYTVWVPVDANHGFTLAWTKNSTAKAEAQRECSNPGSVKIVFPKRVSYFRSKIYRCACVSLVAKRSFLRRFGLVKFSYLLSHVIDGWKCIDVHNVVILGFSGCHVVSIVSSSRVSQVDMYD